MRFLRLVTVRAGVLFTAKQDQVVQTDLGPRRIDGAMMDIGRGAAFLGLPPKAARARIERGTLPYRRLGGRIVFLRRELERFLESLDGVTLDEALSNLRISAGGSADDGPTTSTPLVVPKGNSQGASS